MRLDALPPFAAPAEDPDNEPRDTLADAPDPLRRPCTLVAGEAGARDLVWTQKPCVARRLWPGETAPVPLVVCYAAPSEDAVRAVLADVLRAWPLVP